MPAASPQLAHDPFADLVEVLQPQGGRRPVVVVHAMGGQAGCYQPLADCLAPHVPVYGLRTPKPGEELYPLASVETMAEAYLHALATVPGLSGAHLVGWSMGGLIAYEMARRLEARRAPRGAVVLIDTWLRREQLFEEPPQTHVRILDRRKWRVFMKLATGAVGPLEDDDHLFWAKDAAGRMAFILEAARQENPERYGAADAEARLAADYDHYMVLRGASDGYRPRPLRGEVAWIAAEDEKDLESPGVWAELAQGGCRVSGCPGRHLQIVHQPYVSALAAAVRAAIDGAG